MLLCSPVLVYLWLHLLALSDLLFSSTRAPQPSFIVSLSCWTHPCAFCASTFYALCAISIQYTIPLLCILTTTHSSFSTPEILSTNNKPHLFFVQHTYSLCAPFAGYLAMLLHALPMLSALPDHHCNSSSSLAVKPMFPSSMGVIPRFLHLSNSRDSSFSLLQSSSTSLLQLQASNLFHLSIASMHSLHSTRRCLETLQFLWQSH
jgi:hypothetical protein